MLFQLFFKFLFFLPLVNIFYLFFFNFYGRLITLFSTLLSFFLIIILIIFFNYSSLSSQFKLDFFHSNFFNVDYSLSLDGLSILFVFLTNLLIFLCTLLNWTTSYKLKEFLICLLLVQFFLLNVFCVGDLVLFYIFFEAILMPLFIMIGVWGSRERKVWAAYQFFLYTLFGSVFMLLAIIFVYLHTGFTDFYTLGYVSFSVNRQFILWILFFFGFAIKVPMFPVHIWLPEAHVEAPTAGSVLLAGVLLKLGTYGVLRFLIPLFPVASFYFAPLVFLFSLIGVVYASLATLTQVDLKKIVAYSSVAHMSFVVLGLFGFNIQAVSGSIFLMLSHGLVSGGLFFLVGFIYDRYKTRLLPYYGGLITLMPLYSFFFLIFSLSNMALPGTSSFIGEFLIMLGLISFNSVATVIGSLGMVFSAAYSLWLYNRLLTGSIKSLFIKFYSDLSKKEFTIMFILLFFVILTGCYPSLFLDIMSSYTYTFFEHILI